MFSINYYSYGDSSQTYIYFGGYETSYASSDDDIVWFDLTGSGFWEIDGGKVYYGKDSNDSLGTLGNAIIDTGSSIAYVDYTIIDKIVEASGSAVATGVNVLVVNDWYDSAGSTDYHGLCGISADTFS